MSFLVRKVHAVAKFALFHSQCVDMRGDPVQIWDNTATISDVHCQSLFDTMNAVQNMILSLSILQ